MIIDLSPDIERVFVQQAQKYNMRTEDFIVEFLKTSVKNNHINQVYEAHEVYDFPFNYDLERMKKAVDAPSIEVPHFDTPEELVDWLDNLTDNDFN